MPVLDRSTAADDLQAARSRRRRRQTRAASTLHVLFWASVAMPFVLFFVFYDGLSRINDLGIALTAAGSLAGMVGTDLVLVMVLLAARVPQLDRIIGHDTAMAHHRRLGKPALYLILAHGALYTLGRAAPDGFDLVGATRGLLGETDLPLAYIALVLFVVVVVSSVVASLHRASYEVWYAIHVVSYLAILLALPHQGVPGGVLAGDSTRYVYWLSLYAIAFGALLVFRVVVPLVVTAQHDMRVDVVEHIAPDVVSIHLRGRHLDRLDAAGGQYAVWRFWSRSTWWHAHPISFSAVPTGTGARLTARTLGAGSARISRVRPGTRVWMSGPLGIFTDAARTSPRLSLVAAGVGVTPVRALLEDTPLRPGEATVVLRGTNDSQQYLWDEIASLAAAAGSTVHTVTGPRPAGRQGDVAVRGGGRGRRHDPDAPTRPARLRPLRLRPARLDRRGDPRRPSRRPARRPTPRRALRLVKPQPRTDRDTLRRRGDPDRGDRGEPPEGDGRGPLRAAWEGDGGGPATQVTQDDDRAAQDIRGRLPQPTSAGTMLRTAALTLRAAPRRAAARPPSAVACDLLPKTQTTLCSDGELATAELRLLRYKMLHVAA